MTPTETAERIWGECLTQLRALSTNEAETQETRILGICLRQCADVLHQRAVIETPTTWRRARLYFDGEARRNPGPGGSRWAPLTWHQLRDEWDVLCCGFKYQGAEVTNNTTCEYEALREGLAHAWTALQRHETHLVVIGDSNLIVARQTGRALILSDSLKECATRVRILSSNSDGRHSSTTQETGTLWRTTSRTQR